MAEPTSTPITTPKRKRGGEPLIPPIQFSFDLSQPSEDGSNSPRSKVAHKFRGLDIASGGGVEADDEASHSEAETRGKRQKPDEEMGDATNIDREHEAEEVPKAVGITDSDGKTVPQPEVAQEKTQSQDALNPPEGSIRKAYPSINRLSETKSRITKKKRSGTPPPRRKARLSETSSEGGEDDMDIVEPVRAALTWREDEITIYDPDDPEDDGTGINGVGFKPTHALAQARVAKRRQQMAEYRKREASEARAKRNQRRRDQERSSGSAAEAGKRKVQFMEDQNVSYGPIPL